MLKTILLSALLIGAANVYASIPTDTQGSSNSLAYMDTNPTTGEALKAGQVAVYDVNDGSYALIEIDSSQIQNRPWLGHSLPVRLQGTLSLNQEQTQKIASTMGHWRMCLEQNISPADCAKLTRPQTSMMAPYQIPLEDCLRLGIPLEQCFGTMPK